MGNKLSNLLITVASLVSSTSLLAAVDFQGVVGFGTQIDSATGPLVVRFVSVIICLAIGGAFWKGTKNWAKGILATGICVFFLVSLVKSEAIPIVSDGWSGVMNQGDASASSMLRN